MGLSNKIENFYKKNMNFRCNVYGHKSLGVKNVGVALLKFGGCDAPSKKYKQMPIESAYILQNLSKFTKLYTRENW